MSRVTISLSSDNVRLARQKAAEQKRSTSSYIALLIEADLRTSGALNDATSTPRLAAITAQLAADPVALTQAETLLARRKRARRKAA